MSFTSANI